MRKTAAYASSKLEESGSAHIFSVQCIQPLLVDGLIGTPQLLRFVPLTTFHLQTTNCLLITPVFFSWLSPLGSIQTCGSEAILLLDTYLWFSKVVQPRWYCYIAYHVMKPFEIHSAALGTLAVTTSQPADPFFTNQMIHRKGRWA